MFYNSVLHTLISIDKKPTMPKRTSVIYTTLLNASLSTALLFCISLNKRDVVVKMILFLAYFATKKNNKENF